jgi:hypothetical protein
MPPYYDQKYEKESTMKQVSKFTLILTLLSILILSISTAAAPTPQPPNVTFTLLQGLPDTMQVGESYTVAVLVTSDVPFLQSAALPSAYFPGRYVVAAQGDHSSAGTTTTLYVTFTAKGSTAELPNGAAPVSVSAGARFKGGYVASQVFDFLVTVP